MNGIKICLYRVIMQGLFRKHKISDISFAIISIFYSTAVTINYLLKCN